MEYSEIYDQEAFGALVQKWCVCGGYANAYKLLLDKVGVECRCEMVVLDGGLHLWNIVKIEGKEYKVCPTNGAFLFSTETETGYLDWQRDTIDDVIKKYNDIYNADMPERTVNGRKYGGKNVSKETFSKRHYFGNSEENYIELENYEYEYTGKKVKPIVVLHYNGQEYRSGKGGALKIKVKAKNWEEYDVKVTKVKGNKEATSLVKSISLFLHVSPKNITSEDVKYKLKNGNVKSVKVQMGNKYKKVNKKYWSMSGNCIVFSGRFTGTVSVNELS